jgi:uncharacterized membrane protein YeaQ/YmgE (transglycosylase-associated protein family)
MDSSLISIDAFCQPTRVGTINQNNFSLPALFVSLLGAVILLAIVNLFRRGTVR